MLDGLSEKGEAEVGEALPTSGPMVQAEDTAKYPTWTVETRTYFFLLGFVLPSFVCVQVAYLTAWISHPIRWLLIAYLILCIVSAACVAACCIAPCLGFRRWFSSGLMLGLVIWTPISVPLFFATGMLAMFVSMLVAGVLFVFSKALTPLYLQQSTFTVRQLMWLTTLVAVVVAATGLVAQAVGGPWALFFYANYAIAIGTPGATLMTLAVMISDYSDAKRKLKGLSGDYLLSEMDDAGAIRAGSTNASVADRLESRAKE